MVQEYQVGGSWDFWMVFSQSCWLFWLLKYSCLCFRFIVPELRLFFVVRTLLLLFLLHLRILIIEFLYFLIPPVPSAPNSILNLRYANRRHPHKKLSHRQRKLLHLHIRIWYVKWLFGLTLPSTSIRPVNHILINCAKEIK